ncbi:MAG: LemA family protein [Pseudomonadota bacterium]
MKKTILLLTIFAAGALFSGCGYNRIQGLDEEVKASWSEIQNQFQRRYDLIPNLVNTVKGYAKHERGTLEAVTNARAKVSQMNIGSDVISDPAKFKQFQQAQGELSSALNRLMVVVERYPDLKASDNFRDLQAQLEGTENRIAVARMRYINAVKEYNKLIRFFPTNLTAKILLRMGVKPNFELDDKSVKENPKVSFE